MAPAVPDRAKALAWARAERANLLACLDDVTRTGQYAWVVALTAALAPLLGYDGPWADVIARHATAVQAARQAGDRLGEAGAGKDLGDVQRLCGDYPSAVRALAEALGIYQGLGNRPGEANTLIDLGDIQWRTGDYPAAVQTFTRP